MSAPEFSRRIAVDRLGSGPLREAIAADMAERAALCARFGWVRLDRLEAEAEVVLTPKGVEARGSLQATVAQACVVTHDAIDSAPAVPFHVRFVEEGALAAGNEVELSDEDLDVIPFDGQAVDLGEAVAQTLALALDPFPRGPRADAVMRDLGAEEAGPFAGLKDLLNR